MAEIGHPSEESAIKAEPTGIFPNLAAPNSAAVSIAVNPPILDTNPLNGNFRAPRGRPTASDNRPRPHECEFCGKCFLNKHTLDIHAMTHTGDKPFFCPLAACTYRSNQLSALYGHVRRKHSNETDELVRVARGMLVKGKNKIHVYDATETRPAPKIITRHVPDSRIVAPVHERGWPTAFYPKFDVAV